MLFDLEVFAAIRVFFERVGDVLLDIAAVTFLMWLLVFGKVGAYAEKVEALDATVNNVDTYAEMPPEDLPTEELLEYYYDTEIIRPSLDAADY